MKSTFTENDDEITIQQDYNMIKAVRLNLLDSILRKIESVSSSVIAVK
jgi:hypothetical protein